MSTTETSTEVKAKILLDEANLAFSETSERRDSKGERNLEGSAWEEGRMEGEYDEADYQKILDLQMRAAIVCDDHPELEDKTAELFQSITQEQFCCFFFQFGVVIANDGGAHLQVENLLVIGFIVFPFHPAFFPGRPF